MTVKALTRDGAADRAGADHQDPGLPRPRAAAGRGGRGRRHRGDRRASTKATVADTLCEPSVETAAAGPADRPADHRHDLLGQRRPLAGQDGNKVTSRLIWERLQREAEGNVAIRVTPERGARRLRGRRPRRAAAGGADRDHAPRGLRAVRRPAARAVPDRSRDRRAAGADRGGRDRRRRGVFAASWSRSSPRGAPS